MLALTIVLGLMLGAGADCRVAVDYGPMGPALGTDQHNAPAPPPPPPSPLKEPAPVTWIRVHGRLYEYKLVKRVLPEYPESACEARIAGTVHLAVTIAKDGSVRQTKVIEGDPRLSRAAESAIKQWRYRPMLVNGNRVEVTTEIYVRFVD